MSWDGMYPPHACKGCGKELGEVPAELYAGTYTGLCYPCTLKPPYVVKEYSDGAKVWSHPPTTPSHRRDRQEYTGYDDCQECGGKGKIVNERLFSQGGPWASYCKTCFNRFYSHPTRVNYMEMQQKLLALITEKWEDAIREHTGLKGKITQQRLFENGWRLEHLQQDLAHIHDPLWQAYRFGRNLISAVQAMKADGWFDD